MRKKILSILFVLVLGLILTGCSEEEKKTYTVTFDTVGGSAIASQTVEEGAFATKPDDPTKEGYTFDGWEHEGEKYSFNTTIVKDITLTATWKTSGISKSYYVNFDTDGGNVIYPSSVKSGEAVPRPTDPVKEGYTFKYWSLNDVSYDFSTPVTEAITLKAIWEQTSVVKDKYTVTFNADNDTDLVVVEVKAGKKVSKPTTPKKTGYVFLDWYNGDVIYNFSNKVQADLTLVAKWAKEGKYTVQFETDGANETIPSVQVDAGKTVTKPTDPTKDGYVFIEWQLNGKKYDFATKVSEDMILKAKWDLPKFTVTFDSQGGTSVSKQTVYINKTASKPKDPTKTGYTFVNWMLGENVYDFATPVTENITLKATWNINQYTVTFDSDGGSTVDPQTIDYNGVAVKPTNPTKEGHTFKEWQLNGKTYNFSTKVTKNITLKAVWTKVTIPTYTFTLTPVDLYSPDRVIKVFANDVEVSASEISELKYTDGIHICYGANMVASANEIESETKIKVVLKNGTEVTANKK